MVVQKKVFIEWINSHGEDPVGLYYIEGSFDSQEETKPTGADALWIADGSWLTDSYAGEVYQYNKASDTWKLRIDFESGGGGGGGGSSLPDVTDADDGKFLRVVNGEWAAATVDAWQGGSY